MQTRRTESAQQEPMGIVIADGGRGDAVPKFSAFVWGPAPEDTSVRDAEEVLFAWA